jgi:hypothetical protein
MADRREAILARLLEIIAEVFETTGRNKNEFSDLSRPAGVLLDGSEEADDRDPQGRPVNAPRRVVMKPSIVALASGTSAAIGTTMNGYRGQLLKKIVSDTALLALVLNPDKEQSIRYLGGELTTQSGDRATAADLHLEFAFTYVLRFDEL